MIRKLASVAPAVAKAAVLALGLALLLNSARAEDGASSGAIRYSEPSIGLLQEFGMLQSGRFSSAGPFSQEWVDHFGAFYAQEATLGERLDIAVGLGGIFQFQKPEEVSASWGGSQYKNFFIGPSRATLGYRIGDPSHPWLRLGFGMFPFKYNPEAHNLGEYLFRTNPYPNYIMTGGYAVINNASAYLQGAQAELRLGNFAFHLLLATETTMPPLYDWSVAGLGRYRSEEGFLEVGAGVNFKRALSIRPSRTRPEVARNAYFRVGGNWYSGSNSLYRGRVDFAASRFRTDLEGALALLGTSDPSGAAPFLESFQSGYRKSDLDSSLQRLEGGGDAGGALALLQKHRAGLYEAAAYRALSDSVSAWTAVDTSVPGARAAYQGFEHGYFTSAGTVLMGRFTLDPKRLFAWKALGAEDLKLYGEAALLGWKDYPIFYEDKARRMPVMLGVNLPAFGLLDLFAVQVERYDSPFLNSTERVATAGLPQPFIPRGTDTTLSRNAFYDAADRDNLSWSILLKKEILPGVTVLSQFARDHLRLVSLNTWFGPALETDENLGSEKDWYWMVQVGIGI